MRGFYFLQAIHHTTMQKVVCFGAGPKFKGGMSNYNTSLAKAFDAMPNIETHIVSWIQQYPAIIPREFIDKSSKTDFLEGTNIQVHYLLDYNKFATWVQTYQFIAQLKPSKVIIQWSIAIQGLPLGWLASKLKKHTDIEVVFDLHFVIQKENSLLDKYFTKYGLKNAETFVVHALKTANELKQLYPNKNFKINSTGVREGGFGESVIKLYHPVYDLFKPDETFDIEQFKQNHKLKKHVFLFFGFIRKYKGLHNCIEAFNVLAKQRDDVSLLICGESFWNTLDQNKLSTKIKNVVFGLAKSLFLKKADDEKNYNPLALIEQYNLQESTMVVNEFIPNEDVNKYFQVSDAVLLFYEYATPSGVESIGYNFKMPILATEVGHFPETVQPGFNGYLAKADNIESMAAQMAAILEAPIPRENVAKTAEHMSWSNYALAILGKVL